MHTQNVLRRSKRKQLNAGFFYSAIANFLVVWIRDLEMEHNFGVGARLERNRPAQIVKVVQNDVGVLLRNVFWRRLDQLYLEEKKSHTKQ